MSLQVVRTKTFIKQYNKLGGNIQGKVISRLELLVEDEFNITLNNHPLKGEFVGMRSINITGDIRLIYEKQNNVILLLLQLGTHSQLY